MARRDSLLVLYLLALVLTIACAQESSVTSPSPKHRHRHHHHHNHHRKDKHHRHGETRGTSTRTRKTSKPFNLDRFIADEIKKAVKDVEQVGFSYFENPAGREQAVGNARRQSVGEAASVEEAARGEPFSPKGSTKSSVPSSSSQHQHRKHHHHQLDHGNRREYKQHRHEEMQDPAAAGAKLTSKPFDLDWFIVDKIKKAVKEVEQDKFSHTENPAGQASSGETEGKHIAASTEDVPRSEPFARSHEQQQQQQDVSKTRPAPQAGKSGLTKPNHLDRDEKDAEANQAVTAESNSEGRPNEHDQPPAGLVTSTRGPATSGAAEKKDDNGATREARPVSTDKPKSRDTFRETEEEQAQESEPRRKSRPTKPTKATPSPTGRSTSQPSQTSAKSTTRPPPLPGKDDALHRQAEDLDQGNPGKQPHRREKKHRTQTDSKRGRQIAEGKGSKQRPGGPADRKKTGPVLSQNRAQDHWEREPQETRPPKKSCPGCSKRGLTITRARELHKQVLKAQLLDKLRLVPTFTKLPWPPKLPDQVFPDPPQRDHDGYDDQYYAKPDRLLVFGRDLGPRYRLRKSGTGSYQFAVTGKVKGRVTSADLWVYKMKDANDVHGQTLVITDLRFSKRHRLRQRSLVARLDTHVQEGWLRFDVTRLVHRWLREKTPPEAQMLAIRCKTCHRSEYRAIFGAKSNFRPVLAMQERADVTRDRREKRDACDPNVRCCKFDMNVHFRDLGIYEIFHPRSLKVDYCYGTCERPDASHFNHTVLIQRQRFGSYEPVNKTMFDRLKPCCVPVVLGEASLMHYINDGLDTEVSWVPNIVVERCGCA